MSELPTRQVIEGDCLSVLKGFPDNSIDLIASDPPYQLCSIEKQGFDVGNSPVHKRFGKYQRQIKTGFMQKEWDILPSVEIWKECLRILKHGAFAFILCTPRLDSLAEEARRLQEAGFIISFSPILWAYGCLTDDTEVYTNEGWKDWHSNRGTLINKEILCYDIKNGSYVWEKPSAWHEYRISEEVYRIRSDETDQLVTRDHRVFTEKGFILAGNASKQESVAYLPVLPEGILGISSMATEGGDLWNILFNKLSSESKYKKISFSKWKTQAQEDRRRKGKDKKGNDGRKESCLEGGCHIFQNTWKLCRSKIYSLSKKIQIYGAKGWLCYGTPLTSGATIGAVAFEERSSSSFGSRPNKQQNREFSSVCEQQRTQTSRGRLSYKTTLATITREHYNGIVFCPTVSTGCFIARRNGQIFITGNSGFPKALNISKAVDRKLGYKRTEFYKIPIAYPDSNCWSIPNRHSRGKNIGFLTSGSETIRKDMDGEGNLIRSKPASEQSKRLDGSYAGAQFKPAVEIVIVAMKPLSEKTYVEQALKNGKGVTWLDEGRIPYVSEGDRENAECVQGISGNINFGTIRKQDFNQNLKGRFPANLLVSDDVLNDGTVSKSRETSSEGGFGVAKNTFGVNNPEATVDYGRGFNDSGSFSRYFSLDAWFEERIKKLPKNVRKTFPFLIVPKASPSERNDGLEGLPKVSVQPAGLAGAISAGHEPPRRDRENIHPTVKPYKLFTYLITIGSREGDIVLDPFLGSGTTAIACEMLSRKWVGIEINREYANIARERLKQYIAQDRLDTFTDIEH